MKQSEIKYSGNGFLAWGYSSIFFSVLVYICLRLTSNELFYILYAGIPISANITTALMQKGKTKSDTENLINKIWSLFGILALLCCIGRYYYSFPLFALISFLMGIETTVTGIIIKNKMVSVLGFTGILGMVFHSSIPTRFLIKTKNCWTIRTCALC
jgi:hypothetical protein